MTTRWVDIKRSRPLAEEGSREYARTKLAVDFSDQLRGLRRHRGISPEELARRTGIAQPTIANVEAGEALPSLRTLARIADALDADLSVHLTARAIDATA